jgi:hypothetical protein
MTCAFQGVAKVRTKITRHRAVWPSGVFPSRKLQRRSVSFETGEPRDIKNPKGPAAPRGCVGSLARGSNKTAPAWGRPAKRRRGPRNLSAK